MFTGKDALILFYGIFWATVLATSRRYRPFDTHLFFSSNKRRYAIPRFLVAFGIINVAPILWLWLLYNWIVPETSGVLPIMAGAFASLSVFGFGRILHAVIATKKFRSKFYPQDEWRRVIKVHIRLHCRFVQIPTRNFRYAPYKS